MAHLEPLDPKVDSIRILTLLPRVDNPDSKELFCKLENKTLASKPKYEALSHAWGPNQATDTIFINGQKVLIRPRLHDALRSLQTGKGRSLWADALCINMEDTKERNDHVSMMSYIYSRATRVLAYLGPSHSAFSKTDMKEMGESYHYFSERNCQLISESIYWTRRWTIQEIIQAKEIRFHLGKGYFTLDNRFNSLSNASNSTWLDDHLERIENHRKYMHSHLQQLEVLLEMFKELECEDTRDKIFSLLGVADDTAQELIEADYAVNYYELYANLIDYHQSATPLQCRSNLFRSSTYSPEPWRENWQGFDVSIERSVRIVAFSNLVQKTLNSAVNQTQIPKSLSLGDPIVARGVIVGKVLSIGGTYDDYVSSWEANKKWKALLESTYKKDKDLAKWRENDAAFYQEMLKWDHNEVAAIQSCDTTRSYGYRESQGDEHITREALDSDDEDTQPRRFLGTKGLMGFLPPGAKEGDQICSFWEACFGVVIREVSEDRWMIVGRATMSKESLTPAVTESVYHDALHYGTENTSYSSLLSRTGDKFWAKQKELAYEALVFFKLDIPTLQKLTA
ncbi:unnamed protein product [Clonostachys byssicola]|uniref:Heterokaryon incompatibility domain-containing protein n=1 Tax=Clonostachys byssicola TaxID=160290 RepID=A0A9N9XWI6_9HYPO|nr:unnamed protein product [Clonostachys byssicola]